MTLPLLWKSAQRLVFPLLLLVLPAGAAFYFYGNPHVASIIWMSGTAVALVFLLVEIAVNIVRGQFALDMVAALAMIAALLLGEGLTGCIIAVMYSGGQALEDFAQGRVKREMNALLAGAPRSAARYREQRLEEVPVAAIAPGDRLLVRRGEVVPVDGWLRSETAVLDQSTLTGEAMPVRHRAGASLMSGATNAGDAFDMDATNTSAESTYAGIVRLVQGAQNSKAPIMRIADRYAVAFLLLTLAVTGAAWYFSGDPARALAVLVVATPCPLILAVPVAILSGVSHCARRGILVKGGEALERLAQVDTVLLDKTGTITDGHARLTETRTLDGFDALLLLRLAASLDQGSPHIIAHALVAAARERGLALDTPSEVKELSGIGIEGRVAGFRVALGGFDYVSSRSDDPLHASEMKTQIANRGMTTVVVAVNGRIAGALLLADRVRSEAPTVLRQLRDTGVGRIVLLTGDRPDIAADTASFLGIDGFVAEMKPQDKASEVEAERTNGRVLMVGDGVNDAPALAAADVGVAMGARGAAASSEAADAVILLDRLDRLVTALRIARRSRAIALESAIIGIGLSLAAMAAAMLGYLPAIEGAILQEGIDVAVILNALRALGGPILSRQRGRMTPDELMALEDEHRELAEVMDEIRSLADGMPHLPNKEIRERLGALETMLRERLLPHEKRDDDEIYPRFGGKADGIHVLTGMSRGHMEIRRQVHSLGALFRSLSSDPSPNERREIQRLLDSLEAITSLHFDQEDEIYRQLEAR